MTSLPELLTFGSNRNLDDAMPSPVCMDLMTTKTAHFITVDGIDGVGKSTQLKRLKRLLEDRGHDCVATRDPGSSPIGLRLRELLLESELTMHPRTEAMLFMASRCEMIETMIKPALASGVSVISDRFLLANVVYQSVSDHSKQLSPDLLWQLGELANGGVRPDLTLLLDMPAEAAVNRMERPADRMESRGVQFLESVRRAYLEQLSRSSAHWIVIDAEQSADEVGQAIESALENYLERST